MRIQSLIVWVSLLFLNNYALAQKTNFNREQVIIKAGALIDRGNSRKATLVLDKLIKNGLSGTEEIQVKILTARSWHENGKRVQAIQQLQDLLTSPVIRLPQNIDLRTEAYLQLAECYFGMYSLEKFKNVSDTVLQISRQVKLPSYYKARAYNNIARYYNYHTLVQKTKPFLDSAISLFQLATRAEKQQYHPLAILTASINYYRNSDINKLFCCIDSAKNLLLNGYQGEIYDQIYLWRAIGNSYFDRARLPEKQKNRQWYNRVESSFNKSIFYFRNILSRK
ncbi:MAG: hypothetical protein IPP81_19190 [Chitinophagaceae bacterium]|nr:hypothetical protein [Chitinophagaceae bacterium]